MRVGGAILAGNTCITMAMVPMVTDIGIQEAGARFGGGRMSKLVVAITFPKRSLWRNVRFCGQVHLVV